VFWKTNRPSHVCIILKPPPEEGPYNILLRHFQPEEIFLTFHPISS